MTFKHLPLLAIWLFSLISLATSGDGTPGGDSPKRILVLGDSLTAGYGIGKEAAFPALLQKKLDGLGADYRVINAGVSGDTSRGGLNRLDWLLRQPVHILILELGANDGLRGIDLATTQANLAQIIEKTRGKFPNVKILLAGMKIPPNLGAEYCAQFEAMFPKLARDYRAELIPFLLAGVAGDPTLNLEDRIHPTAAGHRIVAETVWLYLKPLLEETS